MKNELDLLESSIENLHKLFDGVFRSDIGFFELSDSKVFKEIISNREWNSEEEFKSLINLYHYDDEQVESKDRIVRSTSFEENPDINELHHEQELVSLLLKIIYRVYIRFTYGNFTNIDILLDDLENLIETESINEKLYEFDIYGDEIIKTIQDIVEILDLDEAYSSPNIENIKVLSDFKNELLYQVSRNPDLIHSIEPRLFEEIIEKILKKFKLKTELTKRTRDGGYDIIALDETSILKNKYLVECKRFNPNRKVDINIVRNLYGVKTSERATKALLITSSSYTRDALKFAEQHCWELELFDYKDLSIWLKKFWK
ncbi:MAG: hypothetical protein BalsKO_15390 [Balneolaceae bacterium]